MNELRTTFDGCRKILAVRSPIASTPRQERASPHAHFLSQHTRRTQMCRQVIIHMPEH